MSDIMKIYSVSLKNIRAASKKRLRENEQCYNSLNNKDSEYARIVKALQDLHRQVYEIYKNAPNELPVNSKEK
jgi:hypothetical protein